MPLKLVSASAAMAAVLTLSASAQEAAVPAPPVAAIKPFEVKAPHGATRTDNYYWLREKENPEVIQYLEAENAYADALLAPLKDQTDAIYKELEARFSAADEEVPYRMDGYFYQSRYAEGADYPQIVRRKAADAPEEIVYLILGSLQFSEAHLRVYGHPGLLAVAAAVNGDDFVPFNEALFVKAPGLGASVAWHQDGVTHWKSPDLDPGTHGFNFMAQLYGCTPANGVWVVPGSHRHGKADIRAMAARAGSDRLPDAVPIVCKPGDVAITNRQAVHGSFANTSPDWRITLNMGFHRRSSVLNVQGGGIHTAPAVFD